MPVLAKLKQFAARLAVGFLFVVTFCAVGRESNLMVGQTSEPSPIFKPALGEIRGKVKIPILLPTRLPDLIGEQKIKGVFGDVRDDGYFISLYYAVGMGDAGYAAGFSGSTRIDSDLPNSRKVKLADGTIAMFRPVSCGGSCAPANLWWVRNGFEYGVQIAMSSTADEEDQLKVLLETANSMVPAR